MSSIEVPQDPARSFGYTVLGPVFAAFALLLVREARQHGIRRMVFLARDGDLLQQATACLLDNHPEGDRPELFYLRVSRRTAALAALDKLDLQALNAASRVRAGEATLRKCLEYQGLDPDKLAPWLEKHQLSLNALAQPSALMHLLDDREFQAAVAQQAAEQRSLLTRYMSQAGALAAIPTAWVDIGWRGTIQRHLAPLLKSTNPPNSTIWFYFGLWNEHAAFPALDHAVGLICDQRRKRNFLEGTAWYSAHLLEAVCRAEEGTALGYTDIDGTVIPRLLEDRHRLAEIASAKISSSIRTGILDRIQALAADPTWHGQSSAELRRQAQRQLRQLAFFPSRTAIDIGRRLVHSEGHAPGWHAPLILPGPNPWRSPRAWLAGLTSPWRAGYVAATGGPVAAALFAALEASFSLLPVALHAGLANLMRQLARIPVQPAQIDTSRRI